MRRWNSRTCIPFGRSATEDLVVRQAALTTQARQRQTRRDKELNIFVSLLLLLGGFLGGGAATYGTVYEGWTEITYQICLGLIEAGICLTVSTALLEMWRGEDTAA